MLASLARDVDKVALKREVDGLSNSCLDIFGDSSAIVPIGRSAPNTPEVQPYKPTKRSRQVTELGGTAYNKAE